MVISTTHQNGINLESQNLVQILETKENKIIKNVKIRWMNMLKPLKKIIAKYCLSFIGMQVDCIVTQVTNVNISRF
jgi:hypothetical protein